MAFHPVPESECWKLLSSVTVGRLAVVTPDGADIFPLTHRVHDGAVYFRTAAGTKLAAIADNPRVAFEADGTRDDRPWSVVVRGVAHPLIADDELIAALGYPDVPDATWFHVRINPLAITGRRA